jgi:hypothetical protein
LQTKNLFHEETFLLKLLICQDKNPAGISTTAVKLVAGLHRANPSTSLDKVFLLNSSLIQMNNNISKFKRQGTLTKCQSCQYN